MKYITIILALLITLPTFGAYGGGTKSSILTRDYCPTGDYTRSYYDGDCGKRANLELTKAKINQILVKDKYPIIFLFVIQERARDQYAVTESPYHKAIYDHIIRRIAFIF